MGDREETRATWQKKESKGVAQLEEDHVLFRGDFRVKLSFDDITEAAAAGETLEVRSGGHVLTLHIGARAAGRWAEKITNPKSVIQKLGVKAGEKVALFGVAASTFAGCEIVSARAIGSADHIFLLATKATDLHRLRDLRQKMKEDGSIWVIRPKGKDTPVTEAASMAAGKAAGLVDVKVVRYSDTHTAEKYVIPVANR